jgi:hypothetical protein
LLGLLIVTAATAGRENMRVTDETKDSILTVFIEFLRETNGSLSVAVCKNCWSIAQWLCFLGAVSATGLESCIQKKRTIWRAAPHAVCGAAFKPKEGVSAQRAGIS